VDNNEMRIRGTVVADPTQRVVANGARVTTFRLASNTRRLDKTTGEWVNVETLYMTVNCWRQLAENTFVSLHRGDVVEVRGRVKQREYDDKDGKKVTVVELEAYFVGPDMGRYLVSVSRPPRELPAIPEQSKDAPDVQEPAA
jgi:single-strand DNA-binding protein